MQRRVPAHDTCATTIPEMYHAQKSIWDVLDDPILPVGHGLRPANESGPLVPFDFAARMCAGE
jgi:hypothetical protein